MLKIPSAKQTKKLPRFSLNLIPVLNSALIFVFFPILTSAFSPMSIGSHLSLNSGLATETMTLEIKETGLTLTRGEATRTMPKNFGSHDLENLKKNLADIKSEYPEVKSIDLVPKTDLTYEELQKIMEVASIYEINFTGLKK